MTSTITARSATIDPGARGIAPFRAFVAFEARRTLRSRRYLLFAIGFPVVFYLLYTGILGGGTADPAASIGGIPWRVYYMLSMATYGAIGAALGTAVVIAQERSSGWVRQLRVTPLPARAYVLGKLAVASLVTVPAIAAVLAVGALIDGVHLPAMTWPAMVLVLAIGAIPFAALAVLIGYLFEADAAQGAMTICFFGLALLGGLWAPITSFPATLATIGTMLPSFRLADLGRAVAAGATPDVVDLAILAGYGIALGALAAWRYRRSTGATHG